MKAHKTDPRITPTPKVARPLNVPYISNSQKSQAGAQYFVGLLQKKPNFGAFPDAKGGPKKTRKPRQNF